MDQDNGMGLDWMGLIKVGNDPMRHVSSFPTKGRHVVMRVHGYNPHSVADSLYPSHRSRPPRAAPLPASMESIRVFHAFASYCHGHLAHSAWPDHSEKRPCLLSNTTSSERQRTIDNMPRHEEAI